MIWKFLPTLLKTGAEVYSNKQKAKIAISQAELLTAEKMAKGELEYTGKVLESQKNDFKDEFVLIILSAPILLMMYGVFSEDPEIKEKLDLFFEQFKSLPMFWQVLWVSVCGAVFGIKATNIIKR